MDREKGIATRCNRLTHPCAILGGFVSRAGDRGVAMTERKNQLTPQFEVRVQGIWMNAGPLGLVASRC